MEFYVPLLRAVLVLVLLVFSISSVNAAETPRQITNSWGIFTGDAGGQGVAVQGITPASPAAKAGLQTGDVLLSINGAAVHSAQEFRAVKNTFPLYTPLHLEVKRNGTLLKYQIILTGIVMLEVTEVRSKFTIPGVPPPAPVSLSAIEALDTVNVLDQVILDPRSGKLAIIGHYDKNYNTGPIPYLDLLKTALAYPTPLLNIEPTAETKKQLEELKQGIIARLENIRTNEVIDVVQGHPDLERDRQLMIRELAKAYGLSPEEYVAWYNYTQLDVMLEENRGALPPPLIRSIQIKVFRNLGYDEIARAMELTYQNTLDAAAQALQVLGRGDETAAIMARSGQEKLGALMVSVHLTILQQANITSSETLTTLRNRYDAGSMTWQEVVQTDQNLMPYYRKNSKISLMDQVFNRITLSPPATTLFFPQLPPIYSFIDPIGLDRDSQLTRILYEADYSFKSVELLPELFANIPGFRTYGEFMVDNRLVGGESKAKTSRIWMQPKLVAMTAAPERNVVAFTSAQMTVYTADANDLVDMSRGKDETAEPYLAWTARHIISNYEEYARILPALHKVREAAKVIALAQWLRAEKIPSDLGDVSQEKWSMPDKFPLLCHIEQAYVQTADGKTQAANFLTTDGGVNFNPKGNWTQMSLAPQSETKALSQLTLSAGLGQQAVQAAQGGNLEQARYLAELSAQAMNGSLSKSDLAKMNIVVPEARPVPVSPVNVQLQKEMIKKTHQNIAALSQNPSSVEKATVALNQLNSLYDQVRNNPVAASDYLTKLQTVQLPPPATAQATTVKPPAGSVCGESSLGAETLPAERKEYLIKKLNEAQDRLKYINEALRKLIAINAAERAEIDKLTDQISQDFEVAKERAYDFVVATLIDLPLDKYVDIHSSKVKQMKDEITGLIGKSTTPMSDAARAALNQEINLKSALRANYEDSFAATGKLLVLYKAANYGNDIYKWEQDGRNSSDNKKAQDGALLAGKILLDRPKLEEYLSKKEWFGNNKLWQVVTMGKMASYASGFFWDVMDLYVAWGPQVAKMKSDLNYNTQAMEYMQQKAAQTSLEISCLEKLLR